MLGLSSAARTVFRYSNFYNRGFLRPNDGPANSLIQSPHVERIFLCLVAGLQLAAALRSLITVLPLRDGRPPATAEGQVKQVTQPIGVHRFKRASTYAHHRHPILRSVLDKIATLTQGCLSPSMVYRGFIGCSSVSGTLELSNYKLNNG